MPKFELQFKKKFRRENLNSIDDTVGFSTIPASPSTIGSLRQHSVVDFSSFDHFNAVSDSDFFYIHPAEVEENVLSFEYIPPRTSSQPSTFTVSAKKFFSDLYQRNPIFSLHDGTGGISSEMVAQNFEILYHVGIDEYLPHKNEYDDAGRKNKSGFYQNWKFCVCLWG